MPSTPSFAATALAFRNTVGTGSPNVGLLKRYRHGSGLGQTAEIALDSVLDPCARGLYVNAGRCSARAGLGQACAKTGSAESQWCSDGSFCSHRGVCENVRREGQSCDEGGASLVSCGAGLRCVRSVCAPFLKLGEKCRPDRMPYCRIGEVCRAAKEDPSVGKCEPIAMIGEHCEATENCFHSLRCATELGVCEPTARGFLYK